MVETDTSPVLRAVLEIGGGRRDGRELRVIPLPVASDNWAALQARFPMTEQEWERLCVMLEAMKPAIVATGSTEANPLENLLSQM